MDVSINSRFLIRIASRNENPSAVVLLFLMVICVGAGRLGERGGSAETPAILGLADLAGAREEEGTIGAALSPCMLVAGTAVWDLLFQAKLLFVAAMVAGHLRTPEPFGRLKLRSSANCHAWEVNDERQAPNGRGIYAASPRTADAIP